MSDRVNAEAQQTASDEIVLLSQVLSQDELRAWAGDRVYRQGERDVAKDRVWELKTYYYPTHGRAEARIYGQRYYRVRVRWSPEEGVTASCTCRWAAQSSTLCRHQAAVMLTIMEQERQGKAQAVWEKELREMLRAWRRRKRKQPPIKQDAITGPYYLAFALRPIHTVYGERDFPLIPLYYPLPPEHEPAPEEALALLENNPQAWQTAQAYLPVTQCANLPPEAVGVANLVIGLMPRERYYYLASDTLSQLGTALLSLRALSFQRPVPLYLFLSNTAGTLLRFWPPEQTLDLHLQLKSGQKSFTLTPVLRWGGQMFTPHQIKTLWDTPFPVVVLDRRWLLLMDDPAQSRAWEFLETLARQVRVPKVAQERFLKTYLPQILQEMGVESQELQVRELPVVPPRPRLYLQEDKEQGLVAELRFAYGEEEVPYTPRAAEIMVLPTERPWVYKRLRRDVEAERKYFQLATSAEHGLKRGTKDHPERLLLRKRVHPIDFLMEKVPKLAQAGFEIYGEKELSKHRVNRHPPTLRVQVNSGIDWFDLQVEVAFGDQVVSLKEVLRALKRQKRYVKLADGTMGAIPEEWLQRYKHLFDLAEMTDEGHLRVADYHAALVEEILEDEEAQVRAAQELRERIRSLKDVQGLREVPLPKGLRGQLRPYQVAGYRWLHFLHDNGFGGILADDMGLGKTVQVLAFLLSLRERGHAQKADLIVVPRSLLVNWQREVEKFTPDLKVLPYFGPGRPEVSAFDDYDLVLTTYGVMRMDADKLRQYRFHYIVLDESQAIKNPLAKTARAARKLQADHRLALTGTPVENTTFELWSQMAFVMPGLLGSMDYFKENFAGPIERQQDESTARRLRRLIYPFILRRTKEQVAPELPPRVERVLYCDMEPAQRRLYEQTRDAYRAMLLGLIEEEGLDKARMKVLEGLLRLRQIANHPRLVKPDFRGASGKMETLMETIATLAAEGHKALVFSQFVQMLKLVRAELEQRGLPYVYLDGSTTDRQTPIDRFQSDPAIPFFLISLRAGGLGLNLTAADYVIHIDPWWNPAVERQATDRTHRIGQDKPVFVFKLITRDTVEEKILQLQEQKKALVEQLITAERRFFKELTPDDVRALFS